jgi:hypothetical protein
MRIRGEIIRKRLYAKSGNRNYYPLFLRIHEGVIVDGVRLYGEENDSIISKEAKSN